MPYDYLVVGAGMAGATVAERLASQLEASVLVVDRRPHVGGNTHDPVDASGVRIHQYGPHIFHTNARHVVEYLSRFTSWRRYEHRVLARVDGQLVPIPINRATINAIYGASFTSLEAQAFLAERAESFSRIDNSEQMIRSRVGNDLYEKFFRGYTRKQWGLDPAQLDATVCGRIPTRTNDDDRYFSDTFQHMPADGFTSMVERMLSHPLIDVVTDCSYREIADRERFNQIVFTGPIDEFFDYRFGELPYRSLRFEFETLPCEWSQPVAVINEPSEEVPYTRTTEYKHLTGQTHSVTTISREYPSATGDPYYPIPRPENRELFRKYEALARGQRSVSFVGRLAEYKYYNMDQVIASALLTFEELARTAAA